MLGRMRLAEPFEVSILDDVPLWQVGRAAEVVGSAAQHGWSSKPVRPQEKFSSGRPGAIREGFEILSRGVGGVDDFLKRLASECPDIEGHPRPGIHQVFGSFRYSARRIDQGILAELVQDRMQAVARAMGIVSRMNRTTVSPADGDQLTLKEAAKELGVPPAKLRNVGVRAKIIPPVPSKNFRYWISPTQLDELKSTLADLITRAESMSLLAMTAIEFEAFCKRADLVPLTRLPGGDQRRDLFRRSTLIEKGKVPA